MGSSPIINYPQGDTRDNWVKHGERPSIMDIGPSGSGAKGDVQFSTASTTATSTTITSVFSAATGTITAAGVNVTGAGTKFLSQIKIGLWITASGFTAQVGKILTDTSLILNGNFPGAVSAASFTVGTGFNAATDVGKRIIVPGAGSVGARVTHMASSVVATESTDTVTPIQPIDTFAVGTMIGFAGNCEGAGVTWQVFGSNASNFAGESSVHGPTALTALAASDSYIETPPTFRYYRIKIQSTSLGVPGLFKGTIVVLGHVLGTTIASVTSPTACVVTLAASGTVITGGAYFGTDDTAAIQAAWNTITTFVPPLTADGGMFIQIPRGKYLISGPLELPYCVVSTGHHGGASMFIADAEAFPINTPVISITGKLQTDERIAFFTRLEEMRVDCQHVPGSIGIFCDAVQENSGLWRPHVINWMKTGIQVSSASDQFGCNNWIIFDPNIFPSNAAFLDDTVTSIDINFAPNTTIDGRGTIYGQGGFVCGYGRAVHVRNGFLKWTGELHCESARIGIHFDTGGGGYVDGADGQGTVQTLCQIEGGLSVILKLPQTAGQVLINDVLQGYVSPSDEKILPEYTSSPLKNPAVYGASLQMGAGNADPNVITWNALNFGNDDQGGFFSVNSRADGFPNWAKTSSNASNKGGFYRLAASAFEIMFGAATNSNGTDPGTRYLRVDDVIAGAYTPRMYFDGSGNFTMGWGNNLDVNRAQYIQGGTAQALLKLQSSTNSGGSFSDFTIWDIPDNVFSVNGSSRLGPASLTAGITGTLLVMDATPTTGITNGIFSGGAGQGSTAILTVRPFGGSDNIKLFPDGGTDILRLGVGAAHPTTDGWAEIKNFLGIGGGTQTGAEFLHNFGASLFDATVTLAYVVAHQPLKVDPAHGVISGLIDITSANDIAGAALSTDQILVWSGTVVAGITGLVSGVVTELVSPAFFTAVTSVTLTGVVPPGLTVTTTTETTAIKATAINNHIVDRGVVTT